MRIKEKEPTTHTEAPQVSLFARHPRSAQSMLLRWLFHEMCLESKERREQHDETPTLSF
jgi:hypothetical protein